jgi:hypothetical protein
MKKNYHYLYTINDLEKKYMGFLDLDSFLSQEKALSRDFFVSVDRQNLSVNKGIVNHLIDYAVALLEDRSR